MLTVVGIMAAGMVVGYLIRNYKKWVKLNDRLTMWAIYLLLFLLGISIGSNKTIINNLGNLGLTALLITVFSILGSVLVAWVGYRIFFKRKGVEHEE